MPLLQQFQTVINNLGLRYKKQGAVSNGYVFKELYNVQDWNRNIVALEAVAQEFGKIAYVFQDNFYVLDKMLKLHTKALQIQQQIAGMTLGSPAVVKAAAIKMLGPLPLEQMEMFILNSQNICIKQVTVGLGTVTSTTVSIRRVMYKCVIGNAAAAILAHNHPGGILEFSQADKAITSKINDALAMIDVRLLDHLVVANNEAISMAEKGLL